MYNKFLFSLWLWLLIQVSTATAQMVQLRTLGGPGLAEIYPSGVVVTPAGDLIIADTGNDRVVKYTPGGTVLWSSGESGDGVGQFSEPRDIDLAANGNIIVTDNQNKRMVLLDFKGNWIKDWRGPASNRVTGGIMGMAVKGSRLYVAESASHRIRVWDTAMTKEYLVIKSHGVCQLGKVRDVDADENGNIYATSYPPKIILKFSPTGQCLKKWNIPAYGIRIAFDPVLNRELMYAGRGGGSPGIKVYELNGTYIGGMGTPGEWHEPGTFTGLRFLTVAPDGDVLGGDLHGYAIERFDRTVSGWNHVQVVPDPIKAPPLSKYRVFNQVRDVAFDANGDVRAIDYYNNRVVLMSPNGDNLRSCGTRKTMGWPNGVAVDTASGNIWYPDVVKDKLRIIRPDCTNLYEITAADAGLTEFGPVALAIRHTDRQAFIIEKSKHRLVILDTTTRKSTGTFGKKGSGIAEFKMPQGIALDPVSGNIWIADTGNNRIVELTVSGSSVSWKRSIAGNFSNPEGVAVDSAGRIFVADTQNDRIVALDSRGIVLDTVGGLNGPTGVAVNAANEIYVSDTYNNRIRIYSMDGTSMPDICGNPNYDRMTDKGLYIWERRPCGGARRSFAVRAVAGGTSSRLSYAGLVNTDLAFANVTAFQLEGLDRLTVRNNGMQIDYSMSLKNPWQDGFEFQAPGTADICFGANLPAGTRLRVGLNATPVNSPVDLTTLTGC